MSDHLLDHLEKIHTTELGTGRIRKNLGLDCADVVGWCRRQIQKAVITKKGKNWYARTSGCIITVNAHSFTIITAHKADNLRSAG